MEAIYNPTLSHVLGYIERIDGGWAAWYFADGNIMSEPTEAVFRQRRSAVNWVLRNGVEIEY